MIKKKIHAKEKALHHFDDFYASVYAGIWPHIRSALLKEDSKYVAVVNNFGDVEETVEKLQLLGAMDIKDLYNAHKQAKIERDTRSGFIDRKNTDDNDESNDGSFGDLLERKTKSELQTLFPSDYEPSSNMIKQNNNNVDDDDDDIMKKSHKPLDPVEMRPLESDIATAKLDEHRIVKPSIGLTSSSLYEYIPATKLKGLDDYVFESDHYNYYTKSADFNINVVKENTLNFPEHLKIYTFDSDNYSRFPTPKRSKTDVLSKSINFILNVSN